jgi:hypothetical protein
MIGPRASSESCARLGAAVGECLRLGRAISAGASHSRCEGFMLRASRRARNVPDVIGPNVISSVVQENAVRVGQLIQARNAVIAIQRRSEIGDERRRRRHVDEQRGRGFVDPGLQLAEDVRRSPPSKVRRTMLARCFLRMLR